MESDATKAAPDAHRFGEIRERRKKRKEGRKEEEGNNARHPSQLEPELDGARR